MTTLPQAKTSRVSMTLALMLATIGLCQPSAAQDMRLTAAAKATLKLAQAPSFDKEVEHCGLLAVIPNGRLIATKPRAGRKDSCKPKDFSSDVEIVASYHTHGSYDADAYTEFPSSSDVLADRAEGIDGFVSTPGGRMWYIDSERATVRLVCGAGCLPVDPDYQPDPDIVIKDRYSLRELRRIEQE